MDQSSHFRWQRLLDVSEAGWFSVWHPLESCVSQNYNDVKLGVRLTKIGDILAGKALASNISLERNASRPHRHTKPLCAHIHVLIFREHLIPILKEFDDVVGSL